MHIRILKCWRSIWCLWYGLNSQERWVGSPIGNVCGFPVGSWSLHSIWKHMSTYARCQSIAAVDVMVFQNVAMQYEEVVYGNESISICLLAFAIGIHSIWLHHMYWCGVLGEDYDGFICVMNSNLFLLTRMIVVSLNFPKFSQWGFLTGFYIEWVHVDDDFCPSIFPMGVSGFIFHGAIQNEIPEHWCPVLAWGECLMVLLWDYVGLARKAKLNGWLQRSASRCICVHNHTTTQRTRRVNFHN